MKNRFRRNTSSKTKGCRALIFALSVFFTCQCAVTAKNTTVVDAISLTPLPRVSIFDRTGRMIGTADDNGILPSVPKTDLPLTLRSLGYQDISVSSLSDSIILMNRMDFELPEVQVSTGKRPILHIVGFIREISTLSSYTDTVTLYREKWVDFMVPPDKNKRFRGWLNPRILKSKSYYKFTNSYGLDSVSDESNHHFSWSDWISLPYRINQPDMIAGHRNLCDSVLGKYSPAEIWERNGDNITVEVNVLADTIGRRWMPRLSDRYWKDTDFDRILLNYEFADVDTFAVRPLNLESLSCYVESKGRGHNMFRFNRKEEPFYVTTYSDLNILSKEFISVRDANKMEKDASKALDPTLILFQSDMMPKDEIITQLIDRVNKIDKESIRLATKSDPLIGGMNIIPKPVTRKEKIRHFLNALKDTLKSQIPFTQ
ncbi:MAG: carboxypeptidase-like regulatory domain-containing protein [Muribaculaceae bacterium]|nr:carboxypeptidase-like regulatory domain-containing protein [Muribaculaceae bacterium]